MTQKVKYRFEFSVSDSWKSGESACWTECPFSPLIGLGHTCKFLTTKELKCPFCDNKFKTLIERDCTVEVRHGKWLNNYKSGTLVNEGFVSSCCDMWNERKSSFCPNCGAKME